MLFLSFGAQADTIFPVGVKASAPVGDNLSIDKIVTVEAEPSGSSYTSVSLDLSFFPSEITASTDPASYTGSYDRSTTNTFPFTLDVIFDAPGEFAVHVLALVDGASVAEELDIFRVSPVPVPGALVLFSTGLLGLFGWRRFRKS
jgi:hypothetical protein